MLFMPTWEAVGVQVKVPIPPLALVSVAVPIAVAEALSKKLTVPTGAVPVTVAVRVTLCPNKMLVGSAVTAMEEAGRLAAQAKARLLTSTEPRPVTRL